jgi:hypothetical protein
VICIVVGMLLVLGSGAMALADRKADLQKAFEQRYPQIQAAKAAGKVGETTQGLIEAVKGQSLDAPTQKLVDDENRDRNELYQLIAKETNATPQVVAEQNARRNFQRAKSGEWLKSADGRWEQKK